jgi:integrase/recombinase XerC
MKLKEAKRYIQVIKEADLLNKKRDLAIVKIFLYAGLRVSELVELNVGDINYEDKSVKFYGKGNKERYVPLHSDTLKAIKEYLPVRNKIETNNKDSENALFLSTRGNRISPRSIQLFVKKYAKMAGIKNASKITPHKLRHTFATILYHNTKDIKVLQDLLGHENISTTQIYTHTDQKQKKEAIDELPEL